jgi:hypothetical protein
LEIAAKEDAGDESNQDRVAFRRLGLVESNKRKEPERGYDWNCLDI